MAARGSRRARLADRASGHHGRRARPAGARGQASSLLICNTEVARVGVIRFGASLLRRLSRAKLYRKKANKYAELAEDTTRPDFLTNLFRKIAVRYVLMAEDLIVRFSAWQGSGLAPTFSYGRFAATGVLAACRTGFVILG
jgi:hypothetical protein